MKKFYSLTLLIFLFFNLKAQTRTYSYIDAIDKIHHNDLGNFTYGALPIWEDSTILQKFSTGYGRVNFSSVAAALNPRATLFNDSKYAGEFEITVADTFYVDSIYLTGIYMTPNNMGAISGDRIDISVVLESDMNLYIWSTPAPATTPYLVNALPPTMNTTLRAAVPFADPIARIAGDPTRVRYTWSYFLSNNDTSMRSTTNSYSWKKFGFAAPSTIMALPGDIVSVSFTFFSGGSWSSSDSLSVNAGSKNHFRPRFIEENPGNILSYRNHTENGGGDFCNSSLMFASDPSSYLPAIQIERINTPQFRYEHLDVDWVISCPTAGIITSVDDLSKTFKGLSVYPNPSSGKYFLNFGKPFTEDVHCSIYSITGERIKAFLFTPGQQRYSIDLNEFVAGSYICELQSHSMKNVDRIRLIKY